MGVRFNCMTLSKGSAKESNTTTTIISKYPTRYFLDGAKNSAIKKEFLSVEFVVIKMCFSWSLCPASCVFKEGRWAMLLSAKKGFGQK